MQHVTHVFGGVGAGKCHQRPECDARTHDVLPVVPVAQVSKDRSQKHVTTDKNWKETGKLSQNWSDKYVFSQEHRDIVPQIKFGSGQNCG